jgi:hypothetical protein
MVVFIALFALISIGYWLKRTSMGITGRCLLHGLSIAALVATALILPTRADAQQAQQPQAAKPDNAPSPGTSSVSPAIKDIPDAATKEIIVIDFCKLPNPPSYCNAK